MVAPSIFKFPSFMRPANFELLPIEGLIESVGFPPLLVILLRLSLIPEHAPAPLKDLFCEGV